MKIITTLLIMTLYTSFLNAQGLTFDPEAYNDMEQWEADESFGFSATNLPSKISYRMYTPRVLNQGNDGSCVGYAVGYAQITTQQNIAMGITNYYQRSIRSMDPYFVFPLIGTSDWCKNGTPIAGAIWVLEKYGNKPMVILPLLECQDTLPFHNFTMEVASMNTIEASKSIDPNDLIEMKKCLNSGFTISIGTQLTGSFTSGSGLYGGNWQPGLYEATDGGHAMLIVGYDNYRNGGSFEVMNSWGSSFGDNGFVWIKYSDIRKYCKEAYVINVGDSYRKTKCSLGDCSSNWSRYTYDNGNIYEGQITNKRPDVYGSMIYSNGDYYGGGWSNGRKHGFGVSYIMSKQKFFIQSYDNDNLLTSKAYGFAENQKEIEFLKKQFKSLQQIFPGELIDDPDSEEFIQFEEEYEVPASPVVIEN